MNFLSLGKNLLGGSDSNDMFNPMAIFKQFDRNGDGKITAEDFIQAIEKFGLGEVGEEAVRAVFSQIDTNNNGKLDMSEAIAGLETIKSIYSGKFLSGNNN